MSGYAVIDLETTGLHPEGHDRVVEIAIVLVDENGTIESEWETLVNPHRDLGPVHIHGIRGADVAAAPDFAQIIGTVIERLTGRVVVAHNASFEARFLRAEFERAGLPFPLENSDLVCTLKLAKDLLPGSRRSLADCCAAFDIDLHDAHEALADTRATAQLLGSYIAVSRQDPFWTHHLERARRFEWPPATFGRETGVSRARHRASERTFLEFATSRLAPIEQTHTEQQLEYLALIDEALSDGMLSVSEADALHALAERLGFIEQERATMHLDYFGSLVSAVWADAILTAAEAEQVGAVGRMLDIPQSEITAALMQRDAAIVSAAAPLLDLQPGALIVLTGEMRFERAELELELVRHGFAPHGCITKKVSLLVAADVTSLSGKARKARDYGIPIVGEEWLTRRLGLVVA